MSIRGSVRTAALASFALAAVGAAEADTFMKAAGMPGDATLRGFEQQIALSGASLSISNYLDPGIEGETDPSRYTTVDPLMLNKAPDRSSPRLMLAAVNGEALGTVEITFTSASRPGGPQSIESRWILEGAEVRSFNTYPGASSFEPAVETVELHYTTMRYQHYAKDARGVRTGTMEEVTWDTPDPSLIGFEEGCG